MRGATFEALMTRRLLIVAFVLSATSNSLGAVLPYITGDSGCEAGRDQVGALAGLVHIVPYIGAAVIAAAAATSSPSTGSSGSGSSTTS